MTTNTAAVPLKELIRDANRTITAADRHAILDLIEALEVAPTPAEQAALSTETVHNPVDRMADAAPTQSAEPIYKLQQVNGAWLDVSKAEFYAIACNYGRIVYATPQSAALTRQDFEAWYTRVVSRNLSTPHALGAWGGYCEAAQVLSAQSAVQDERAAFEAALRPLFGLRYGYGKTRECFRRDAHGYYVYVDVQDAWSAWQARAVSPRAISNALTRDALQQQAIDHGFTYWRAPDEHGVTATNAQAVDLLQDLLGVEVEIGESAATQPAQTRALTDEQREQVAKAHDCSLDGDHKTAREILMTLLAAQPESRADQSEQTRGMVGRRS